MVANRENVLNILSKIIDPELKKDLVSLNFVEKIDIEKKQISLDLYISNPALHAKKRLREAVEFNIHRFIDKSYSVKCNIKASPQKKQEGKKRPAGINKIIAIASGKGGVGKSTITSNLACGLTKIGYKVGIIDADIYGPSIPTMFGVVNERPKPISINNEKKIQPITTHGVKVLSIGFFTAQENAIAWRGPMATRALQQLFSDAHWGELDFLLIDLPPGTGDIHLSLVQNIPLDGAIMVSTPQEIALADVKRGINMFQLESINIPILGIIENMAWFCTEENPEEKHYIFGRDGAQNLAKGLNVPFLGCVPVIQSIREAGDVGKPSVLQKNTLCEDVFSNIVNTFISDLD